MEASTGASFFDSSLDSQAHFLHGRPRSFLIAVASNYLISLHSSGGTEEAKSEQELGTTCLCMF